MIHSAVLHMGLNEVHVVGIDREGHRRKIIVTWGSDPKTDTPPANWGELVEQELEFLVAHEKGVAEGRILPEW